MDSNELKESNAEFAKHSKEFLIDMEKVYTKWMEKDLGVATIMTLEMPLDFLLSIMKNKINLSKMFPDLPDVFMRMVMPFDKLKPKWGKIPDEEFADEYARLYQMECGKHFLIPFIKNNF